MPRYKTTSEALRIITNQEQIRNFGVIAHVDHGKCVSGDSLITLADGRIVEIEKIYSSTNSDSETVRLEQPVTLDSMDPLNLSIQDMQSTAIWRLKSDRLIEVTLSDGKSVKVTPEHPFYILSQSGMLKSCKAEDIRIGDRVATPAVLKSVGCQLEQLKSEILKLVGRDSNWYVLPDKSILDRLGMQDDGLPVKLSHILDAAKLNRITQLEVYQNIKQLQYNDKELLEPIKLPQDSVQFEELFYEAGLVYALNVRDNRLRNKVFEDLSCIQERDIGQRSSLYHLLVSLYSEEQQGLELFGMAENRYLASFLGGLYDALAEVRSGEIILRSESKKLSTILALFLLRFGIAARVVDVNGSHCLVIPRSHVPVFNDNIGFSRRHISEEAAGQEKIHLSPLEIKSIRISLALDADDISPEYGYIEEGKIDINSSNLQKIASLFEQELLDPEKIRERVQKRIRLLKEPESSAELSELIKDGILGNDSKLTAYGRQILLAWNSILSSDKTLESISYILRQWKLLAKGEIKFEEVIKKSALKGSFTVYDLTVPSTHTYVANGIVVHNTTTSDSLLAACGMLSPSVAGQALALDYMELEQQRQMTIKAANVTLYYEHEGKPYVFNMIDTPGHIDFTGKVTRSLRAIDGAVVVVDSVEGVMTQTETVTRQALEERVRPVLYINKIDRLVKELRLTPDKMQSWLANIINDFNNLINIYAEPEFRDKWKVSIQDNSVAFGSSKDKWGFNLAIAKKSGISFKDVYDAYTAGDPSSLQEKAPLHEAILTMVINHHPPPHVAQSYRIPKIWKGDINSEVGQSLLKCDPNGPIVMMVTNVIVDPQAGIVATGRLFSGTIRDGDSVYLIGAKREGRVQSVNMYMGNVREMVGILPAGNIPALLGLEYARSGETLSSIREIVPFEGIRYVSEPVVTIAIESKNPRDLPKLVDALQRMHIEDPNLIVRINEESGETLLSGMGVLHLEIATTMLQQQGLEIITSPPLINYRETILGKAGPIMAKSPNRHNKIYIRVEPLSEEIVGKIRSGEISETTDRKGIAKILRDMGWDSDEARSVVAVDEKGNMLLDQTKGVQFMQESMDSLRAGFEDVMNNGPLAYEYCRGVKVIIHHFVPHEDPAHRTYAQLMPAARRAILGAMLSAQPTLLEPIQGIEVKCGVDQIGAVASVLSSKRGKLLNMEQKEVLAIVEGEIPAAETFDLSEVMRGATAGKAMWNIHFKSWQAVPASLQKQIITQIRKRKGLPEEVPPASDFIDTE
ncbi:MAG: elongation factor EF-2 [Conexivisphaerales archaeon]